LRVVTRPSNILIEQNELAKYVTYVKEHVHHPLLENNFDLTITKNINLVFRKDIILDHHQLISEQIKETLNTITDEIDLLKQDNLARGKLVESVQTMAWLYETEGQDGKWNYHYDKLEQKYLSHHPDEYWGQLLSTSDVVAGCRRYPWMPADISAREEWND